MKFLIIGLGSMGKRRIRNLRANSVENIVGFDLREDRRHEVEHKYKIPTLSSLQTLKWSDIDALIISTPPNIHNEYIALAINKMKPALIEASVILEGLPEFEKKALKQKVLIAPSCTMRFHPAIQTIKKITKSGTYGAVTSFSYHFGQYLPDWHPWEDVRDFYVGKKQTGAAREMVAFELTWLVDILGLPRRIVGFYGKTTTIRAPIDDTYALSLDFKNSFGTVVCDVVSRYATRSLLLNMEKGQLRWRWDEDWVSLYNATTSRWIKKYLPKGKAAPNYNKNIIEGMYIDEIKAFIQAIEKRKPFPNTLHDDINILKLLHTVEHYDSIIKRWN